MRDELSASRGEASRAPDASPAAAPVVASSSPSAGRTPAAAPSSARPLLVALAGNPNAGKTTIFNALTGARHKVGNYPGVTVEKREGRLSHRGREIRVVDLPGVYSLTAYSADEVVARDFVLEERPDLVVDVLDSTNLERHLYLCLQLLELGVPVVGALNMSDEAEAKGIAVDGERLGSLLGLRFVKTARGAGMEALLDAILEAAEGRGPEPRLPSYGPELDARAAVLEAAIASDPAFAARVPARWLALKLLEKDEAAERLLRGERPGGGRAGPAHARLEEAELVLGEARLWLERHFGRDSEIVVSERRYAYVHGAVAESTRLAGEARFSLSEKADVLLMSPLLGLPAFLLVMYGIFKLTFALGAYPTAWLEALFSGLAGLAGSALPDGLAKSLVVDGILGGVGGVLSFVPPIVILFLCLSFLEDTGYMARAAFITDRFLHRFGLHGQSFLPLVLGFGCSVPAIMSARTLKSRRDRVATVLAVPFMSCGAKLPVYVLLAGAFFPRNPAAAIMGVYGAGVALALLSSLLLKRTILRGEATPFVMELPPYRLPTLRGILAHVGEKTGSYLRKAGTVILAASVLIWAVTTFPLAPEGATPDEALAYSAAGRAGKAVEPLLSPLGFDWKIGVAAVTGFAAKEVVVSTLGVLYRTDLDGSEAGPRGLAERLKEDSGMTPLVAFVLMLFVLVMPPCLAALAAIKAELGWRWLAFEAAYLAALSWGLAFLVYRGGLLLGLGA